MRAMRTAADRGSPGKKKPAVGSASRCGPVGAALAAVAAVVTCEPVAAVHAELRGAGHHSRLVTGRVMRLRPRLRLPAMAPAR